MHREGGQDPQIVEGTCGLGRQMGGNLRRAGSAGGLEAHFREVDTSLAQVMTGGRESQAGWKRRMVRSALP
jgi:hypothetical protein